MKYMLRIAPCSIGNLLKRYTKTPFDFGIGLDYGDILCTKIGTGGDNNKDLIWIGNAVNKSTVLSDHSKNCYNIAISSFVYNNLKIYRSIWEKGTVPYNNKEEIYYYTNNYLEVP